MLLLAAGCSKLPSGDWLTPYPTRIFGAPFALKNRMALDEAQWLQRLSRLRYQALDAAPLPPGTYRRADGGYEIHLRGFSSPLRQIAPSLLRASFGDGKLKLSVESAWLEPELLYEISGPRRVRREPIDWEKVPVHLALAVVATEDRRFFSHHGVDLRGLARAAWRDLTQRRLAEGGSTITQQLARNLYLSPRRSFWRKIREMLWAFYLEARYSKTEILRMYLDQVYFGQDGPVSICGIQAASRFFFDKTADRLTLGESALLAGMLASPYRYNPFRDPDEALRRRLLVLESMRSQGLVTDAELARARLEPLRISKGGHQPARPADFFAAYVQEDLEKRYPERNLFTRGLTIYTTLDPWLQEQAQRAVSLARHQAALVALDPSTGEIRALVGGKDFASSPFNRAVSARRQPGSAFKPFVYGAALRASSGPGPWTAATMLSDRPRSYRLPEGYWTPRNYDGSYRGDVALRRAFADSLNAATIDLAAHVTPARIIAYARSLSIASPLKPELGLALGASEVTLLELTAAYCPFGNGGLRVDPYAIEAVQEGTGDILEYRRPAKLRVLSTAEAWLMHSLLREVVTSGTARALSASPIGKVAAGKTGTTDQGRDAWFIGYAPGLACGVWTGEDRPTPSARSGASAALPIWERFMGSAGLTTEPEAPLKPAELRSAWIDPSNGLRARTGCPTRYLEYFLPDTEPALCAAHPGGVSGWLQRIFKPRSNLRQ